MKNHHKLTAGIMSAVIAASSITMSVVFAQGRVSTPDIPRSSVGALYESETFSKTLTPPSKTVYEQGESIDFSDFEIGTIRMTQTIVDGEVKDKYERIAYWVNWLSDDSYFFTDAKGNKYDSNRFSTLPAGKYTVTLAKTIEFSETKDHAEKIMLGGVDYEYEITIKAASQPQTTTATVVTTTATQTTSSNLLWMTTTVYVWSEISVTTSATSEPTTTDTATTTITMSTTEPETTTTEMLGFEPHPTPYIRSREVNLGEYIDLIIYETTYKTYDYKIDDESVLRLVPSKEYATGKIYGIKEGTATVSIFPRETGKETKFTITVLPPSGKKHRGDANCDGEVSLADAVLILQSITNPSKFGLKGSENGHITKTGSANADVSGYEDGVTAADALAVQKYKLGLIEDLDRYGWWCEE